jgi:hypothetical protein
MCPRVLLWRPGICRSLGARKGYLHANHRLLWILPLAVFVAAGCTDRPNDMAIDSPDPRAAWAQREGLPIPSGASGESSQSSSTRHHVIRKDRASWALPLDEYVPTLDRVESYAENLLIRDCLVESDYSWPVPWQDVDAVHHQTISRSGRRLFDVEIAHKWGYHMTQSQSPDDIAWRQFVQITKRYDSDAKFSALFEGCLESIRKDFPLPSEKARYYASGLAAQVTKDALLNPAVVDAAARWRTCLVSRGVADVPATPDEMPTSEMVESFGLDEVGTIPTSEEVELAVADAECMETSGYSQVLYDAEWELQSQVVGQNQETLDQLRDELQNRRQAMLEIIAERAPEP